MGHWNPPSPTSAWDHRLPRRWSVSSRSYLRRRQPRCQVVRWSRGSIAVIDISWCSARNPSCVLLCNLPTRAAFCGMRRDFDMIHCHQYDLRFVVAHAIVHEKGFKIIFLLCYSPCTSASNGCKVLGGSCHRKCTRFLLLWIVCSADASWGILPLNCWWCRTAMLE